MKVKFNSYRSHKPNPLTLRSSPPLSTHSWSTQSARQTRSRRSSCSNSSETNDLSHIFCSEGLSMGGSIKTFTQDVTRRVPPSRYSRSKMGTASVASPTLSGHLPLSMLVIVMRCCSTCLAPVTSLPNEKQETRYGATVDSDLVLQAEMVSLIYVQYLNHLMVMITAYHVQSKQVMLSQLMVLVLTCSPTRRMESSQ
jgi:hypothetical protein